MDDVALAEDSKHVNGEEREPVTAVAPKEQAVEAAAAGATEVGESGATAEIEGGSHWRGKKNEVEPRESDVNGNEDRLQKGTLVSDYEESHVENRGIDSTTITRDGINAILDPCVIGNGEAEAEQNSNGSKVTTINPRKEGVTLEEEREGEDKDERDVSAVKAEKDKSTINVSFPHLCLSKEGEESKDSDENIDGEGDGDEKFKMDESSSSGDSQQDGLQLEHRQAMERGAQLTTGKEFMNQVHLFLKIFLIDNPFYFIYTFPFWH